MYTLNAKPKNHVIYIGAIMTTLHVGEKTGYSFDLSVFYNTDLSRMYFDEFAEGACGVNCHVIQGGYRSTNVYVLGNDGLIFKKSYLNKCKKQQLFDACELLDLLSYNLCDIADYTKSELIDLLKDFSKIEFIEKACDVEGNYNWVDFYQKMPINCDAFADYEGISGYSQGDYAIVIFLDDESRKAYSSDTLHHIFYDAPIYARLIVENHDTDTEQEFYIDEMLADSYRYRDDEILAILTKICNDNMATFGNCLLKAIENGQFLIPEEIDYL